MYVLLSLQRRIQQIHNRGVWHEEHGHEEYGHGVHHLHDQAVHQLLPLDPQQYPGSGDALVIKWLVVS